jgi:hypothetical protein
MGNWVLGQSKPHRALRATGFYLSVVPFFCPAETALTVDPDGRMHAIALPDGQIQVENRKMVRQKDGLAKHDPPCAGPNGPL